MSHRQTGEHSVIAHGGSTPQRKAALLSVAAGVITLLLKLVAYLLTGSVGLLADAAESTVNVMAAGVTLWAITVAGRPPDASHHYGHEKVEYFSSGFEGSLILVAAGGIILSALPRLFHPVPLQHVDVGLVIAVLASLINGLVARYLLHVARRVDSIALRADAHHLLTDVWTSLGVVAGVALTWLTGWYILDPLIALIVALNIVRVGIQLLKASAEGLMDRALPPEEIARIREVIEEEAPGTPYHALRTRKSGPRRFVDLHLLVPGSMSVREAHRLADRIETRIRQLYPQSVVTIHIEPVEEQTSWDGDQAGGIAGPDG
ncbi:MAG: cation transporter [Chloroflexi bacterium]|nr:cation transporter [Chloroflexota bacterium]